MLVLAVLRVSVGIEIPGREEKIVVSLTSIPSRFNCLPICLESLFSQSIKPDRVILWIQDDLTLSDIPKSILRFQKRGLTISFYSNIRSYKKIIPTLREHPDAVIVTADDDILYPKKWLERLYKSYQSSPNCIHCHRGHFMTKDQDGNIAQYEKWIFEASGIVEESYFVFPTGCAGVLYPPGALSIEVLNEKIFMALCPTTDDLWLKAMSLRAGTKCKKVSAQSLTLHEIHGSQDNSSLREFNVTLRNNDRQMEAVFHRYSLYEKLSNENF